MSRKRSDEFYFFFGSYNPLSNWHPASFIVRGIRFSCVEQLMMFCKAKLFGDEQTATLIMATTDPAEHKRLGRLVRGFDKALWEAKCDHYVYTGCLAKAQQNVHIKNHLLNTDELELAEAARNDTIWGVGLAESDPLIHGRKNWRGMNKLGRIWMRIRDEVR